MLGMQLFKTFIVIMKTCKGIELNSLWSSDTIWWHRSGSSLAQVMVCCLRAPSHCLNQGCLIIYGIQLRAISKAVLMNLTLIMCLLFMFFELPHLQGQWVDSNQLSAPYVYPWGMRTILCRCITSMTWYNYNVNRNSSSLVNKPCSNDCLPQMSACFSLGRISTTCTISM